MRLTRRLVAVAAAAALITTGGAVTGVLTGAASAASLPLTPSPTASNNSGTPTIKLAGSGFQSQLDSVVFHPLFTGTEVADIAGTVQSSSTATQLVVTVPLDLAAPGSYDIIVTQMGVPTSTTYQCGNGCFTVTSGSAPSATGSTRDAATGRGDGKLIISGSGFAKGGVVTFLGADDKTVDPGLTFAPENGTATGYPATTQIKGTYTPDYTKLTPGMHFLKVTNTDGQTSGQSQFWQPVIASAAPATLGQGASAQTVTVTGQGIRQGSSLAIAASSSDLTVGTSTVSADGTSISAPVTITAAGTPGARAVTVRSPDGAFQTTSGIFTVTAAPKVTASSVATVGQGATDVTDTLTGTGFVPGTVFTFGGNGLTGTVKSIDSATKATVLLTATSQAATGARGITVINPDKGTSTAASLLTVDAGPTITSVSPASGVRNTPSLNVTIAGTGFSSNSVVSFSGTGVTVNGSPTVSGTTQLVVNVTITAGAASGGRNVTVVNTNDNGTTVCLSCFGVDSLTINGTAGAANTSGTATTAPHTISFANTDGKITAGYTAVLHRTGTPLADQPDITGTNQTAATDGKSGTTDFDLFAAAPGRYDLVVTLANGDVLNCTSCFVISGSTPTVTAISPAVGGQGAKALPVTITGSTFSRGETVTIAGTTVSSVTYVSPTKLTALVAIPAAAGTGAQDVVVTNADGGLTNSAKGAFTIDAGPAPASIAPTSLGQGATKRTVTVTGPGFVTGASGQPSSTLDLGPGITVVSTTVTQGATTVTNTNPNDTLAAVITIDPTATTGKRDVTVTNPDSGVGVLAGGFTVNVGPVVTAISPSTLGLGTTQPISITGTGFAANATPTIPDVTLTNVAVSADGTSITATAAVGSAAARGSRDVTVLNPTDFGQGTLPSGVLLATVPGLVAGLADSVTSSSVTLSWSAPTSDGGSPVTGYSVTADGGTGATPITPVTTDAGTTTTTFSGLQAGRTYMFTVSAVNVVGKGSPSAISATPAAGPTVPTGVSATAGNHSATVSFTASQPQGSAITGYTITSTPGGITATTTDTTTTVTGLTNGTSYTFSVVANSAAGNSAASAASNAVTPVASPGKISITGSPATTTARRPFTFRGTLLDGTGAPVTGAAVTLTFTPAAGAVYTRSVTTGQDGGYVYSSAFDYSTIVRASFNGNSQADTSNIAGVKANVATLISIAGPKPASHTAAFVVTGTTTPNQMRHTIVLYRLVGGKGQMIGKAAIASNGTYRITATLPKGAYSLYTALGATTTNVAGTSGRISVTRT